MTNPDRDTRLNHDDLVFVLAKNDPGDPEKWDEYNENNKEMFEPGQNRMMADLNEIMLQPRQLKKKK